MKLSQRRPRRLPATVGVAADGPLHLDLRAQDPHALVGDATGSGCDGQQRMRHPDRNQATALGGVINGVQRYTLDKIIS